MLASEATLISSLSGGDAQQKRDLQSWLEGWSLCLAEISFQLYGLPSSGHLDVKFLMPEQAPAELSAFAAAGKTLQAFAHRNSSRAERLARVV